MCFRLAYRLFCISLVLWGWISSTAYAQPATIEGPLAERIALARQDVQQERWQRAGKLLAEILELDPDHMEARYWDAVRHRDMAKVAAYVDPQYIPTPNIDSHWEQAISQFEWIIERDSLYEDVLYQYAVLWRYAPRYLRAIELAERQAALRPDLRHSLVGLFQIYRAYIHSTRDRRALRRIEDLSSIYAEYFRADLLRKMARWDEAEGILQGLLAGPSILPPQPVLLSLARLNYELQRDEQAEQFVYEAIESIESASDADLVFEDVRYIVSPEELARYQHLETIDAFKTFFRTFWKKRDPLPASGSNRRMAEHYRRLLIAEDDYIYGGHRTWHTSLDPINKLQLPATYRLADEYDDRGVIFIRHGEPDDEIIVFAPAHELSSTGQLAGAPPTTMSWRYNSPAMDFHFSQTEANWRLNPVLLDNPSLRIRHEIWGGIYAEMARRAYELHALSEMSDGGDASLAFRLALEEVEFVDRMEQQSQEAAQQALTTDRHTWPDSVQVFEYPYIVSAFRGNGGNTQIDVHYALPVGRFSGLYDDDSGAEFELDVGCAVNDRLWNSIKEEKIVRTIPMQEDVTAALTGYCQFEAVPDSGYHVALHAIPTNSAALAGYRFDYTVPDFSGPQLGLSDILPAVRIDEATGPSPFNKGDLYIRPNPFLRYSRRVDVSVYFEIYNLTYGEDDLTRYTLEYEFVREENRPGRLFGNRGETVLSVASNHTDETRAPVHHPAIDVGALDAGRYTLTVRLTDEVSGAEFERTRTLELID